MDKTIGSAAEAVAEIGDGATVMIGGFGGSGAPIELIHALIDKGSKGLTVINNNTGNGEVGLAALIANAQRIALFSGAGISVESGIPPFRAPPKVRLQTQ